MLQSAIPQFKIERDGPGNFWELNPLFQLDSAFKSLYQSDRTVGKDYSSRAMWCIALAYDLNDTNPYRNLSLERRKEKAGEAMLKERSTFTWEKYENECKAYYELVNSVPLRTRDGLYEKMAEREKYIRDTPYTPTIFERNGKTLQLGSVKELDEMIGRTPKLYEQLKEIDAVIEAENQRGKTGKIKSASQTGQI